MPHDPKDSFSYALGEINGKLDLLLQDREDLDLLTVRVTDLEQSRFKLYTVVATVAATVGFVFSNLKEGLEWLTSRMA